MNKSVSIPVIFRVFKGGDVIAMFPTLPGTRNPHTMSCYQHVGQHGSCDADIVRTTYPAKPGEYRALLAELKSIGYKNLKIHKRISAEMNDARRAELNRSSLASLRGRSL